MKKPYTYPMPSPNQIQYELSEQGIQRIRRAAACSALRWDSQATSTDAWDGSVYFSLVWLTDAEEVEITHAPARGFILTGATTEQVAAILPCVVMLLEEVFEVKRVEAAEGRRALIHIQRSLL